MNATSTASLKLGDTVRVVSRTDIHWSSVGRITAVCKDPSWDYPFHVSGIRDDTALWYSPADLEQAEGEAAR